ncbi:integrin alpha-8-like [Hemiscyllium ocellatum]|uniref:integrin alpha-8-like n=1 Tax=Hemiscyllium ocellatum TaxID=170820 RepID=UPI0029666FBE|nr:integrin alpha-8-like [Hemiscyllium ocellatum]
MIKHLVNFYFSLAVFDLDAKVWKMHACYLMEILSVYLLGLLHLHAFNFDAENPIIYSGPEGSFFGFSVEFYLPDGGNPGVLIGAPKANTTQENIIEGGAVFLCPWSSNGSHCNIIPFDTEGDRHIHSVIEDIKEYKSHQWFGATVKSLKDQVLACAPLYHWKYSRTINSKVETGGVTPVGTCLIAVQNFRSYAEYSPCRSDILQWQFNISNIADKRFCEAGWSSVITEAGDILLGAPGSYFWQGQLFATSNIDMIVKNYQRDQPLRSLGLTKETKDARGRKDNHFEGYSLAMGEFTGDSVKDYLLGAPRAKHALGSIVIIDSVTMMSKQTIAGEQVAAYFGYVVAATDINSDGRDDILVGAPLFMNLGQDGKQREVGRVYVYLQDQLENFKQPTQTITGTDKFGRFGSAITILGDLDSDGYKDVAIGAPYAGEDGNGRVFIYLGHANGLLSKSYQELKGTWAPGLVSAGFGFSLQGGADIDANNYTDLIVGAHDVDKVLLYRARPVITANAHIILVPDILNPEEKKCVLSQKSTLVTCLEVRVCVMVKGHDIGQFVLNGQIELDKNKQRSQRRILFLQSYQAQKNFQFSLMRNKQAACQNFTAYLRQETEFKDKLSPIVVTVNCSLSEEQQLDSGKLKPVLSPRSQTWVTKKTRILLDCGDDGICIPDLKLNATVDKTHLIAGDSNPLTVTITAVNNGEGAYETELHIPILPQVDFNKVVQDSKGTTKLSCNVQAENATKTLICDLGNPMKSGAQISARFHFMVHNLDQVENITLSMQIKSKNIQNSSSEEIYLTFPVQVVTQIYLTGASLPENIVLPYVDLESPADLEVKNESLPMIQHTYELHNNGPSAISDAVLEIDWPAAFLGNSLLFKSKIIPWGQIKCTVKASNAENWIETMSTMSPLSVTTENSRHNINKRDVSKVENTTEEIIFNLTCTTVICVKIMCRVGLLEKEKRAVVNINSQLRMEFFVQNRNKQFTFQSKASYIVQEVPYKVQPVEFPSNNTMVVTQIGRSGPEVVLPIPVWCIIVAVLGGLLLVTLMVFILWKCGFFKRKLPPTEREELL